MLYALLVAFIAILVLLVIINYLHFKRTADLGWFANVQSVTLSTKRYLELSRSEEELLDLKIKLGEMNEKTKD